MKRKTGGLGIVGCGEREAEPVSRIEQNANEDFHHQSNNLVHRPNGASSLMVDFVEPLPDGFIYRLLAEHHQPPSAQYIHMTNFPKVLSCQLRRNCNSA